MRGFPLRVVPETIVRVELPHATVSVERAGGRTFMVVLPTVTLIDDRSDADALAKAITSSAGLLGSSPDSIEACAAELERAAAELRKAIT